MTIYYLIGNIYYYILKIINYKGFMCLKINYEKILQNISRFWIIDICLKIKIVIQNSFVFCCVNNHACLT